MKIIDRKWAINNNNILLHFCKGDLKKKILPGFWPVKEIDGKKKCSICLEEVPNHVLIYM